MNKKGFTLIELLMVTSIIMILTSIAYISYDEVRKMTRDNQRKIDLQLIAQALESFKSDYGQYYHFSDFSYSDFNFLQTLQGKGVIRLLHNDDGKCPFTSFKKKNNNKYLDRPFQDPLKNPLEDNPYRAYYYFADTYQISDCIFMGSSTKKANNLMDSYLPRIKKYYPGLDGCKDYGECIKKKEIIYNNLFKNSCYEEGSNKVLYILAANLEGKKSTGVEIAKYFKFCPKYKTKDKDFWKMIDYFESLSLDYFIILKDIVDYWEIEKDNEGGGISPPPKK